MIPYEIHPYARLLLCPQLLAEAREDEYEPDDVAARHPATATAAAAAVYAAARHAATAPAVVEQEQKQDKIASVASATV